MRKVKEIKQFVSLVDSIFGKEAFTRADHWEGDLTAIGLQKDNKLIYVSCYSKSDYFYECEILKEYYDPEHDVPYTVWANGNYSS